MRASQVLNKILQLIRKITNLFKSLLGFSSQQPPTSSTQPPPTSQQLPETASSQPPTSSTQQPPETASPQPATSSTQPPPNLSSPRLTETPRSNPMTNHVQSYGWIPDTVDTRDLKYSVAQPVIKQLPLKVDLRVQLPPVYAQGQIGSCTAQSICAAFHFCQMKEKLYNFAPSRLFTYYTTRDLEGTVNEDSGAMLRNTIKSINKFGACPESIWPYEPARLMLKPTQTCYDTASRHTAVSYYQVSQNLNQMKGCLAEGFPFAFGMTVYDSFEGNEVANTGIVQLPTATEQQVGGHAVLVVGYEDSQQRFIVRNSWGSEWGISGYFTLPYAYIVNPDLATDFWTLRLVR